MKLDPHQRLRAALEAFSIEVDVWLAQMQQLAQTLRAVRATVTSGEFEAWALLTYGMDEATIEAGSPTAGGTGLLPGQAGSWKA